MSVALETELDTFQRELPGLLADPANRDKYALVHRDTVAGIYADRTVAVEVGYDRFGLEPFLVKKVTDREEPLYFSRNLHPCPSSPGRSPFTGP